MTGSSHALSATVVRDFCTLCDKAHEYWLNHVELFHGNSHEKELLESTAGNEWRRLSIISHEYSLLQIVKLHDKAVMNGNITLGIDYMLRYGGWSDSVRIRLKALAKELDNLADKLRDVRNKILSHNDLATIVADSRLGEFAEGADVEYFRTLQEFVNTVHDEVIGGQWQFDYRVKNEVTAFLAMIRPTCPPTPCA